jgi:hypothetical protein
MPDKEPRSVAVSFITSEHFTLQMARSAAITETTGRATIFIGSVSAGMIALGLIATVTHLDTAFYAFGLVVLTTLSAIGFATFDWVVQSGIEDMQYAERIARLRAGYLHLAPELTRYLASVPSLLQLAVHAERGRRWRVFRTVAAMVGLVTAILAGAAAGMLDALAAGHSVTAAFLVDGLVTLGVLVALLRFQHRAWAQLGRELAARHQQEGGPAAE